MKASILTVGTLKRCTKGLWPRELEQVTAIQMPRSTGPSKRAHWNSRPNFDSCPKPLKLTAGLFRKWYHKGLYNAVFFVDDFFAPSLHRGKFSVPREAGTTPNHLTTLLSGLRPPGQCCWGMKDSAGLLWRSRVVFQLLQKLSLRSDLHSDQK